MFERWLNPGKAFFNSGNLFRQPFKSIIGNPSAAAIAGNALVGECLECICYLFAIHDGVNMITCKPCYRWIVLKGSNWNLLKEGQI